MIEDEDGPVRGGEALLYDYFKHLTSLCLISLGGVVALIDKAKGVSPVIQMGVLASIGLAALLSFSGASEIVRAGFHREPLSKYLNACRVSAPVLLSVGLGMFLWIFMKTLRL
jgi:hypothetical protein